MTMTKPTIWRCTPYQKWWISIAILVLGGEWSEIDLMLVVETVSIVTCSSTAEIKICISLRIYSIWSRSGISNHEGIFQKNGSMYYQSSRVSLVPCLWQSLFCDRETHIQSAFKTKFYRCSSMVYWCKNSRGCWNHEPWAMGKEKMSYIPFLQGSLYDTNPSDLAKL